MRRNRFRPGDDAVSPVVGVVLLVGIAVMLTTTVGVFVLGFGPGESAPETEIQFYQTADGNVTATVVKPAGIQAEDIEFQVNGTAIQVDGGAGDCAKDATNNWPSSGSLDRASEITIHGGSPCPGWSSPGDADLNPGTTVRAVWYAPGGGRSEIVAEYEVI